MIVLRVGCRAAHGRRRRRWASDDRPRGARPAPFVDRGRCTGAGRWRPPAGPRDVFTRAGDGKVLLLPGPGADADQARAAAAGCPSGALSVIEYEGSEV